MINKCDKCKSTDLVDVNGVIMCNNCGEILNSDTKKDISIKIDGVDIKDDESNHEHNTEHHCSCDHCDHEDVDNPFPENDLWQQDVTEIDPQYWDVFDIDKSDEDDLDLDIEGYDKLSTLNDLFESDEKSSSDPEDIMNREGQWCYIDDLSDLSEDLSYDDYNNAYEEKYPGLLVHKEK